MEYIIIIILSIITPNIIGENIIGYDCAGQGLNITRMSLLDVGECDITRPNVKLKQKYIRLLQSAKYGKVEVKQCKIEISRNIFHFGMFSHLSPVQGSFLEYIHEVPREVCESMHATGVVKIGDNTIISGLTPNSTTSRPVTLAGSAKDGSCSGTTYSEPYATWEDVIVQANVKITLMNYITTTNTNKNELKLRTGTTCPLDKEYCLDRFDGQTYWRNIPEHTCNFDHYEVLYDGMAHVTTDLDQPNAMPLYTVITDTTFSLFGKGKTNVCGYLVL